MNPVRTSFLLLALFGAPFAHAADGFDCRTASTATERAVCDDPGLTTLDQRVIHAFRRALARAEHPAALQQEQRSWLFERDRCGAEAECLRAAYETRLPQLQLLLVEAPTMHWHNDLTGNYEKDRGWVRVRHVGAGRIEFAISNQWEWDQGMLRGEAMLEGRTAVFNATREDCGVVLDFRGHERVEVRQFGACAMPERAHAEGTYLRANRIPPQL